MPIAQSLTAHNAVDTAIARVLQAEADAAAAIQAAQVEAMAINERTRAAVRALDERTERRIRAARARFEELTARMVTALDAELAAPRESPLSSTELARVDSAVRELAVALTSGPS
jgi:hypothetical protein